MEEIIFNIGDFTECHNDSSKELTNSSEDNWKEFIPIIQELQSLQNNAKNDSGRKEIDEGEILLKEEIKAEYEVVQHEGFKINADRKQVLEDMKFIEESGEVKTEKEEKLEPNEVLENNYYTICKIEEENEPLQCVKDEEITIEYGVLDESITVKDEIMEGKL